MIDLKDILLVFQYFNIYLSVIGSGWLLWLLFDINKYVSMMKKYWKRGELLNFQALVMTRL